MSIIVPAFPSNDTTDPIAYLALIQQDLLDYANEIAIKERLGKTEIVYDRVRLTLLQTYVEVMEAYYAPPLPGHPGTYRITIDLEWSEVEQCMTHINNILKTNYWLDE